MSHAARAGSHTVVAALETAHRNVWFCGEASARRGTLRSKCSAIPAIVIAPRRGVPLAVCSGMQVGVDGGVAMSPAEIDAVVHRVRAEFLEMPGLQLTVPQAARLWGLDRDDCQRVIDTLVRTAFLRWTSAGIVMRVEG
jgi:hypothetical protein